MAEVLTRELVEVRWRKGDNEGHNSPADHMAHFVLRCTGLSADEMRSIIIDAYPQFHIPADARIEVMDSGILPQIPADVLTDPNTTPIVMLDGKFIERRLATLSQNV